MAVPLSCRATCAVLLVLGMPACVSDIELLEPDLESETGGPGTGGGGGGGGGTIQRASLTVEVLVMGTDADRAARLGSTGGRLAEAIVTIQLDGAPATPANRRVDTTDATGRVTVSQLLQGSYRVSVARLLTPEETALLDEADRDVNAFGGGTIATVRAPTSDAQVLAVSGRRGSLVISEIYDGAPVMDGVLYPYARYLEVYNNSDTLIYLDGLVFGEGAWLGRERPAYTCEESAPWRLDPVGIWAQYLWKFPGTGQQYPLAPGAAAVMATDAVNHSIVHEGLPDLSLVRFEFIGSADADNPSVANMVMITNKEWVPAFGRGWAPAVAPNTASPLFLADRLALADLPSERIPLGTLATDEPHFRVPAERLLDVFVSEYTPEVAATLPTDYCDIVVLDIYDRQAGQMLQERRLSVTAERRLLGRLPDGRAILLRTGATVNDFELRPRFSPGFIP